MYKWSSSCAMHSGNALMTFHPLPMVVMMPVSHEASWSRHFFVELLRVEWVLFCNAGFWRFWACPWCCADRLQGEKSSKNFISEASPPATFPTRRSWGTSPGELSFFQGSSCFGARDQAIWRRDGGRGIVIGSRAGSLKKLARFTLEWFIYIYTQSINTTKTHLWPVFLWLSEKELWSLMVWQSHYWIIGCSADFFSSKSEVTYVWLTPPVEREKSTQFLDTVLLFREPLDLQNSTFCTSLAARILKKRPVSFQDRDSKFRLKKSFGPKSICCPQRSDMAHHEKDVINAMSIVMTNLSWQGLQPRPLKEVAQAGLPFRMFVRYLWFFSEESPLDSLLTSKKWHSAAFFEECQVGEADPEDKKAQCLLTPDTNPAFCFFKCWTWELGIFTSADDLVVTCGDLEDLQNLGVPYYAKQWKSYKHHS